MKCERCGKSILLRGKVSLADAVICRSCFNELGFASSDLLYASLYKYDDIKDGKAAYQEKSDARANAHYEFLVHFTDDAYDILEKYQKEWTDPDDRYEGMTNKDIKASGDYDTKIYQYPPLDVDLELFETEIDSKAAVGFNLIDGKRNPFIGYAPKTKAKKILRLIEEHPGIRMSAELSGGHYKKLEFWNDHDYVNSDWSDDIKVRVTLNWSNEI